MIKIVITMYNTIHNSLSYKTSDIYFTQRECDLKLECFSLLTTLLLPWIQQAIQSSWSKLYTLLSKDKLQTQQLYFKSPKHTFLHSIWPMNSFNFTQSPERRQNITIRVYGMLILNYLFK